MAREWNQKTTMKQETMLHCYMRKRYITLFTSNKLTDCSFVLDNEEILSHKLILAASSPVFEAMLYGPLSSSEIIIKDIPASEFKQMLAFIYTDTVQITSIYNAWALVYIAKKYLLDDLLEYCLDYISNHIEASNMLINYENADLFCEETLRKNCENNIQMYSNLIFKFDYHLKANTICYLLDLNDFNAKEEDLFEFVIKWANEECKRLNINTTSDNIRSILLETGILSRIRFLAMPTKALNDNKIYKEILKDDEITCLNSYKIDDSPENKMKLIKFQLNINRTPRNNISLQQKMAFRHIYKTATIFNLNDRQHVKGQLTTNKYVLINGICIPPHRQIQINSRNYDAQIKFKITDNDNKQLVEEFFNNSVINFGGVNIVKTPQPIILEKGKTYNIDIYWTDEYLPWILEYPFYNMSPTCENHDVLFEFSDSFDCGFIQGVCYYPV